MRGLKTSLWAILIAAVTSSLSLAQQPTGTTGTTGTTRTTTGGITSGGAAPTGISGGGGGSSSTGTFQPMQLQTSDITAPTGTAASSLQKSNFLAGYYGNPYFQGTISSTTKTAPGGFGMALYPATGTVAGGRGGATGAAGVGGRTNQASTQSGILIPLPVQLHYTAQMRFPTPAVPATKLHADLRGIIDTAGLANSKTVQVITDANNNVTLVGTVPRGPDEADPYSEVRFIEGLVRLAPGVGGIKNELKLAPAGAGK